MRLCQGVNGQLHALNEDAAVQDSMIRPGLEMSQQRQGMRTGALTVYPRRNDHLSQQPQLDDAAATQPSAYPQKTAMMYFAAKPL